MPSSMALWYPALVQVERTQTTQKIYNTANNSTGRSGPVKYASDMFEIVTNTCQVPTINWLWLPFEKK